MGGNNHIAEAWPCGWCSLQMVEEVPSVDEKMEAFQEELGLFDFAARANGFPVQRACYARALLASHPQHVLLQYETIDDLKIS